MYRLSSRPVILYKKSLSEKYFSSIFLNKNDIEQYCMLIEQLGKFCKVLWLNKIIYLAKEDLLKAN